MSNSTDLPAAVQDRRRSCHLSADDTGRAHPRSSKALFAILVQDRPLLSSVDSVWRKGLVMRRIVRLQLGPIGTALILSCVLVPVVMVGASNQAVASALTWSVAVDIDPGNFLQSVSCPTDAFCMAVDGEGNDIIYAGGWHPPVHVAPEFTQVSCASPTFCVAIGTDGRNPLMFPPTGEALTYDGTSWSAPVPIDPAVNLGLIGISCPTPSFCAAIDSTGHALTYNGTSWSVPTQIVSYPGLAKISCVSATFCVATELEEGSGREQGIIYNGAGWSATNIFTTTSFGGAPISCASSTFCAVMGLIGDGVSAYQGVSTYDGSTWSAPTAITPPGTGPISQAMATLSCPTSTFCAAVGFNGNVQIFDGNTWTPSVLDQPLNMFSVSCPTVSLCVALDPPTQPYAFIYGSFAHMRIVTGSLPNGMVGTSYSASLAAVAGNAPYKWSVSLGTLPPGLHLKKATGVISGKPSTSDSGTYKFTVKAVDHKIKNIHRHATQNTATTALSITIS